ERDVSHTPLYNRPVTREREAPAQAMSMSQLGSTRRTSFAHGQATHTPSMRQSRLAAGSHRPPSARRVTSSLSRPTSHRESQQEGSPRHKAIADNRDLIARAQMVRQRARSADRHSAALSQTSRVGSRHSGVPGSVVPTRRAPPTVSVKRPSSRAGGISKATERINRKGQERRLESARISRSRDSTQGHASRALMTPSGTNPLPRQGLTTPRRRTEAQR
ncbi:hypothetical protein KIPB_011160, partial [Kipferlia bialata]